MPKSRKTTRKPATRSRAKTVAKESAAPKSRKRRIEQYEHKDKQRKDNPPVGLVTARTDVDGPRKQYAYDPHRDPELVWAGKAERLSFEVDTVSLHVHERIDPRTIIEAVRHRNGTPAIVQGSLFEKPSENPPLRDAIDFYQHAHGWSNRLIAGDSLLVMNSLIEKEGLGGQVQLIYFDPPYGITYGSNFQAFVNETALKSGDRDEDLTAEPEMVKAFQDTWELGIHSYLTYLRDRVLLARDLLSESGSIFVQISEVNLHRVRSILDEVYGEKNFISLITVKKGSVMFAKKLLNSASFYVVWYAKDKEKIKYHQLYAGRDLQSFADNAGSHLWLENNKTRECRKATPDERRDITAFLAAHPDYRIFGTWSSNAQGSEKQDGYLFQGRPYHPPKGTQWKTAYPEGLDRLKEANRLIAEGNTLRVKLYPEDSPGTAFNNIWEGIGAPSDKVYVVQTPDEVPRRCLLMTTDPSDLVLDPTCGSGTTAFVAEQQGRRWITCDTSRVSIALAKQRLMVALYDYYELAYPEQGIGSGFRYKEVPHLSIGSIANDEPPGQERLYNQPYVDNSKARVTGPFTVEAVPAPAVKSIAQVSSDDTRPSDAMPTVMPANADATLGRTGPSIRHAAWREELLKTGIRARGGRMIEFTRVEALPGTRYLQADAETKGDKPQRAVVSFGAEHAPLEQRQVELAWEEARTLMPKPQIIVFAAFQFDPEAAKDIDELSAEKTGMVFLKAQMNADLFTEDLKKKRSSNQSFWLIGQPDIRLSRVAKGDHKGKWQIEVLGFDYYNPATGSIESGDTSRIAMWLLDPDYDGRSLFPRQVFFPMAGDKEGWARLAKNLKAEIDEDLIEAYRGSVSLPFETGKYKRVAVKIIDDRGIESLRVLPLNGD